MTNEQAIKRLKHLTFEPTVDELDEEALDMAIEALNFMDEYHQSNMEAYAHDMGVSLEQAERELRVEELSCSENPNRSDLISRQAAIDALGGEPLDFDEYEQGLHAMWQDAKESLERLPSAEPEQRWIPVSERLPEDYTDVLVWFEYFRYGDYNCLYQTYGIGDYIANYGWMINHETGWHKLRVIAWQPLPSPYTQE